MEAERPLRLRKRLEETLVIRDGELDRQQILHRRNSKWKERKNRYAMRTCVYVKLIMDFIFIVLL